MITPPRGNFGNLRGAEVISVTRGQSSYWRLDFQNNNCPPSCMTFKCTTGLNALPVHVGHTAIHNSTKKFLSASKDFFLMIYLFI